MSARIRFFTKHLLVSIVVVLVVLGGVFFVWYPTPLVKATGVIHIVLIMIVIDMVLGPILSFIVYKEHKKSLKMNLTIIILLQLFALSYGVYSLAEGRPAWMVFNGHRFELIRNNEILYGSEESKVSEQYAHPSLLGPKYVAVQLASDSSERAQNMFDELLGDISIAQRPERYVDIDAMTMQILKASTNIVELNKYNSQNIVTDTMNEYANAKTYLGLSANAVDMTVLLDEKGDVIGVVDLSPW